MIDQLRARYVSLPFDDGAAKEYARIRSDLTTAGQVIGANDMLIAAIALANGLTLVTHNSAEFSRVPGLAIEDWETS